MKYTLFLMILFLSISAGAYALDIDPVKIQFLKGDYKAAITEGERILAQASANSPKIDELHYVLGLSYMKDGNLLRASDIFEIVINEYKKSPFRHEAMMGLGDVYLLQGNFPKAEESYKLILKEDPNTKLKSQLYYRLSQSGFKKGELEEGRVYLEKVKDQSPQTPELKDKDDSCSLPQDLKDIYYSVQVGAFSQEGNALNLVKKLSTKGYPAYIEEVKNQSKAKYRVKVGRFKERTAVVDLQAKLSGEGYPTKICP
jgi:tetratricopeptide (TPR) repeat protein